jgi:hypothetical protein
VLCASRHASLVFGFVSVNYSRVYCSGMKQLEFATARSHTGYVAWEYREYAWWWRAKTKDEQECERCLAVFLPCSSSPCFLPSATVSPLDRIHEADCLGVGPGPCVSVACLPLGLCSCRPRHQGLSLVTWPGREEGGEGVAAPRGREKERRRTRKEEKGHADGRRKDKRRDTQHRGSYLEAPVT